MKLMPTSKTSWPIFLRSDVDAIHDHRVAIGDQELNINAMLSIFCTVRASYERIVDIEIPKQAWSIQYFIYL